MGIPGKRHEHVAEREQANGGEDGGHRLWSLMFESRDALLGAYLE